MKKIYTLVLFLTISSLAIGQNYQPYSTIDEALYFYNGYNFPSSANSNGSLFPLIIDSTTINSNGSETHYHYRILSEEGDWNFSGCYEFEDTSWLGIATTMTANSAVFNNQHNENITINFGQQLNDNWILYSSSNGDYCEATITFHGEVTFLNVTDSVKTITLQFKDNAGQSINHSLNGKEIIISKNYGFIKMLNFHHFPNDDFEITLEGHDNITDGVYDIGFNEVFDFNIGDIIHEQTTSYAGPYSYFNYEQRVVLNKTVVPNGVSYEIDRFSVSITVAPRDTLIYRDTNIVTYTDTNWAFLDMTPNDFVISDSFGLNHSSNLVQSNFNNRMNKQINDGVIWDPFSNCWARMVDGCSTRNYYEGLGGPYGSCGGFAISTTELVYYKKGNEEWGIPLNFNSLTTTQSFINKKFVNVSISPNPMVEQSTFEIKTEERFQNLTLTVFNVMGQTVKTVQSNGNNQIVVDRNGLNSGLYFYQIQSEDLVLDSGKLMVQ